MLIRIIKKIAAIIGIFFFYLKINLYQTMLSLIDIFYDLRFNVDTEGTSQEKSIRRPYNTRYNDYNSYGPTPYIHLRSIKKKLKITKSDILVDFGSGKGRVLFFFAETKIKKVIGVEVDEGLFNKSKENLNTAKVNKKKIDIFKQDATDLKLTDETIFFFFHPFGSQTTNHIFENIKKSIKKNPRKIKLVMYVPIYSTLLTNLDWLEYSGRISEKTHFYMWTNKINTT